MPICRFEIQIRYNRSTYKWNCNIQEVDGLSVLDLDVSHSIWKFLFFMFPKEKEIIYVPPPQV